MDYQEVLKHLAPCGLDCGRCADYENSEIKHLSSKLLPLLGNYGRVARIKEGTKPVFQSYAQFEEILSSFTKGICGGCRSENVQCPITCAAKTCYKEQGVDFCFQCKQYPCEQQFSSSGGMRKGWIERNNRMKEIGVVAFYEEQNKAPRY